MVVIVKRAAVGGCRCCRGDAEQLQLYEIEISLHHHRIDVIANCLIARLPFDSRSMDF